MERKFWASHERFCLIAVILAGLIPLAAQSLAAICGSAQPSNRSSSISMRPLVSHGTDEDDMLHPYFLSRADVEHWMDEVRQGRSEA